MDIRLDLHLAVFYSGKGHPLFPALGQVHLSGQALSGCLTYRIPL